VTASRSDGTNGIVSLNATFGNQKLRVQMNVFGNICIGSLNFDKRDENVMSLMLPLGWGGVARIAGNFWSQLKNTSGLSRGSHNNADMNKSYQRKGVTLGLK
jgi:hypothetical protein